MIVDGFTGRVSDYVRTMQLEAKWQQRKLSFISTKTEGEKTQENGLSTIFKQNDEMLKAVTIERIKGKMKAGQKLSHDEKEFLKKNAPGLYEKAIKIEKEREEHRRALRNCKTKEEARRIQMSKCLQIRTDSNSAQGDEGDSGLSAADFLVMRMAAMANEFSDFAKSKEYEEMPDVNEPCDENQDKHQHKRKFKRNKLVQNYEMQNREIKNAYLRLPKMPQESVQPQKGEKAGSGGAIYNANGSIAATANAASHAK